MGLGRAGARRGERRAGAAPAPALALSAGSSPMGSAARGSDDAEEFVEVTLDLQDDDTIVLRSVEPAAAPEIDSSTAPGSAGESRSPSIRRSSSHRLLQFSQELRAEAVARARQFSHDLRAELKRFSRSHSRASASASASASSSAPAVDPAIESALAARAARGSARCWIGRAPAPTRRSAASASSAAAAASPTPTPGTRSS
uniref:Uncharacterized protein n=1 Tax=Ananas comosus var. bracteatus TaxID=296719 RepID=A0A6V7PT60_ANACO|nr:unnamed protein product [Ananas comosus var. bracteatus]